MKTPVTLFFVLFIFSVIDLSAQKKWKNGILVDEFIYTEAPFPEAHEQR